MPVRHTGDGADVSPPLKWDGAPANAKSFALICDDPDAPRGTWVHWVIYKIPADAKGLPEGVARKPKPTEPAGAVVRLRCKGRVVRQAADRSSFAASIERFEFVSNLPIQ